MHHLLSNLSSSGSFQMSYSTNYVFLRIYNQRSCFTVIHSSMSWLLRPWNFLHNMQNQFQHANKYCKLTRSTFTFLQGILGNDWQHNHTGTQTIVRVASSLQSLLVDSFPHCISRHVKSIDMHSRKADFLNPGLSPQSGPISSIRSLDKVKSLPK